MVVIWRGHWSIAGLPKRQASVVKRVVYATAKIGLIDVTQQERGLNRLVVSVRAAMSG